MDTIKAGSRSIKAKNLDKLLFPEAGYTKRDLIDYYREISDAIIPYLRDRPLSLLRYPDGIRGQGFYQKEIPDYFPDWIDRVSVVVKGVGKQQQVVCNNQGTLIYLAHQGTITPHPWLSRADKIDFPDRMIFDLDPPEGGYPEIGQAARELRSLLEEVGLVPFVMTTGSKGFHVVAPLDRSAPFEEVRAFARDLANVMTGANPRRYTVQQRKEKRRGRLFIDVLRNAYGQTAVPPYSVRPNPQAGVAMPLDWSELSDDLASDRYNIGNARQRFSARGDPWEGMQRRARSLKKPRTRLDALVR